MHQKILNAVTTAALLLVLLIAAMAGYRLTKAQITANVYRDRLQQSSQQYEQLRQSYNTAIRKTAITELLVADSKLSVRIRTAQGVERTIDTPFDPASEIYVDYVLIDGRLWIRRVFDEKTRPDQGVVIDSQLVDIDWTAPGVAHGKAAYRRLSPGRWIVTVTGDGSLGLAKVDREIPAELAPPPPVQDFEQVEQQVQSQIEDVTWWDILWNLL